jgi:hypothetical protein
MTSAHVETLRDSAADTLDQVRRVAAPAVKEGKRQAGALFDQSGELIDTIGTRASQSAAELGKSVIGYTKKNPVIALLLAVGAGALLLSAAKSMQSRR